MMLKFTLLVAITLPFATLGCAQTCPKAGSLVAGSWSTQTPSLPTALGEIASAYFTMNGVPYLMVVGSGSSSSGTATTYLLNLNANKWSVGPPRPNPCDHHAVEVINNQIYMIGGVGSQACYQSVRKFDPSTNKWTVNTAHPLPGGQGAASSGLFGTNILVCGGISKNAVNGADGTINNCFYFDTVNNRWKTEVKVASMPKGVNHAASATANGKMWVVGGRSGRNVPSTGFNYVQVFDPSTNSWKTSFSNGLAPLPVARGGMGKAAVISNNYLIVMGGESPSTTANSATGLTSSGVYNRVDIYSISCNVWIKGPNMSIPRHGIFPVINPNSPKSMWVIGGGVKHANSQSNYRTTLTLSL